MQDFYKLTASHYAARNGEIKILIYLLEQNADLGLLDNFGFSPIHYTLMYNKVYAFIFFYFKLGLKLNQAIIQQTLSQMSGLASVELV
jgi:hypothetical protein